MTGGRWFRDVYRDAVWESEELSSDQKAIAETHARHARDAAGDKSPMADLAWVTYDRLQSKAGVAKREKIKAALEALEASGWLVVVKRVNRRPTLYRLAIPSETPETSPVEVGSSAGEPEAASGEVGSSDVGTTVVPSSDYGSSAGSSDVGTTVVPDLDLVVPTPDYRSPDVGTQPSSREPSSKSPSAGPSSSDLRRIVAATGATDDEAEAIIEKIQTENVIRKPFGVYLHGIPDEHLIDHLAAVRAVADEQAEATRRAALDAQRHQERLAKIARQRQEWTPAQPPSEAHRIRRCPDCKQMSSPVAPPPRPCATCNPGEGDTPP